MPQLEKLQATNNKLTLMVVAMGACIKGAAECTDPFEAAAAMHELVGAFCEVVNAFDELGNELASVLDKHAKALNGGTDADDELY